MKYVLYLKNPEGQDIAICTKNSYKEVCERKNECIEDFLKVGLKKNKKVRKSHLRKTISSKFYIEKLEEEKEI